MYSRDDERNRWIIALRKLDLTYKDIAKIISKEFGPISRQRAHFIYERDHKELSTDALLSTLHKMSSIREVRSLTAK